MSQRKVYLVIPPNMEYNDEYWYEKGYEYPDKVFDTKEAAVAFKATRDRELSQHYTAEDLDEGGRPPKCKIVTMTVD